MNEKTKKVYPRTLDVQPRIGICVEVDLKENPSPNLEVVVLDLLRRTYG
jgi:hypothetical protein